MPNAARGCRCSARGLTKLDWAPAGCSQLGGYGTKGALHHFQPEEEKTEEEEEEEAEEEEEELELEEEETGEE